MSVVETRGSGPRGRAWDSVERLRLNRPLAASLLLGVDRPRQREYFHHAGVLHILAVSGLHLGLVLVGAAWCLRLLQVPWRLRQILLIGLAAGFCYLTHASLPTQRAAVMVWALCAYQIAGVRPHPLGPICLAILALLLWDPANARRVGFQFSAAAVLGIVTLGRDLLRLRRRLLPLTPWRLDRPIWRLQLYSMRAALDALAIGLSASWAVLPLLGWYFHELQTYSPLASILVTPPLIMVLACGYAAIVLAGLWPQGPWEGLYLLWEWNLQALVAVAGWCASWPLAHHEVAPPPIWVLLLWPFTFIACRDGVDAILRGLVATLMLVWWLL